MFRQCKKGYLILGGLMLVLSFCMLFKQQEVDEGWSLDSGNSVLAVFLLHMYGMGMRWYIAGYAHGVTRMKQWYMLPGRQSWRVCCL